MTRYKITRYFLDDREPEIISTGLTLKEAREHCMKSETEACDWFDGYSKED